MGRAASISLCLLFSLSSPRFFTWSSAINYYCSTARDNSLLCHSRLYVQLKWQERHTWFTFGQKGNENGLINETQAFYLSIRGSVSLSKGEERGEKCVPKFPSLEMVKQQKQSLDLIKSACFFLTSLSESADGFPDQFVCKCNRNGVAA